MGVKEGPFCRVWIGPTVGAGSNCFREKPRSHGSRQPQTAGIQPYPETVSNLVHKLACLR